MMSRILYHGFDWLGYFFVEFSHQFGNWCYNQGFKHGIKCGALVRNPNGGEPLWVEARKSAP